MDNNVWFALGLTLLAGLSTGIGSVLAFFVKGRNTRVLSVGLGFSAGVMIYVSFVEILSKSKEAFVETSGESTAGWLMLGSFLAGILLTALIDYFVPHDSNPHETRTEHDIEVIHDPNAKKESLDEKPAEDDHKLMRLGLFTALAIGIHNFPEGFATFMAALKAPQLGISIAIAIAIHNIPEGISISVPIFYATGDRKKAFLYSFISGLAEPVGAIIGYIILMPFINDFVFGVVFAMVAGIMIYISFDELLPAAREYGEGHFAIIGLVFGMILMGASLNLF